MFCSFTTQYADGIIISMVFQKGLKPWNKGKHCSEEIKLKISMANKGKIPPNKGVPMTDELKKKSSIAHMGQPAWNKGTKGISGAPKPQSFKDYRRQQWLGKNNPSWKDGATERKEKIKGTSKWRTWRIAIFERDSYTCKECGTRGKKLHPHHIKAYSDYPEIRFDINNGITLCESCHRKSANYGSKVVNERKSLQNLGELLERPNQ